jgi:hypothetical protein
LFESLLLAPWFYTALCVFIGLSHLRVLSNKAKPVSKCHDHTNLWTADLEPLNESGTAFLFVSLSVLKMSFMIEVVVYLTVITNKPIYVISFIRPISCFNLLLRL